MLWKQTKPDSKADPSQTDALREHFGHRGAGSITRLTVRVLRRLERRKSAGSFIQREVRESVSLFFLRWIPVISTWANHPFREEVQRNLRLYLRVFTDDVAWFREFVDAMLADPECLRRIPRGNELAELLIAESLRAANSALESALIWEQACRLSRGIVVALSPDAEKMVAQWSEFGARVNYAVQQCGQAPFFPPAFFIGAFEK